MKYNNKTENYTDFFYYFFHNILLVSIPLVIISAIVLSSIHSSATGSGADQIQFSLSVSCTLSSVVDSAHTKEITNGTYHSDVGKTTITTLCNDGNGYSVYANGYSNNEEGNNKLINAEHPEFSIDTGLATSGLTSAWAMKLNNVENDPTPPTIETPYNDTYGLVPTYWTKVASKASGTTDMDEGSSFTTTYAIYTTSNQHSGTYNGQVKYLLTHPSTQNSQLFIQDTVAIKNNLPNAGDSMQAIDQRDGKSYWVTKLADGHIWMTQNLDFDINTNTTLNSETTDLNAIYNPSTGQYAEYNDGYTESNGTIYWKPTTTATTINFERTTVTGWVNSNTEPYSASKTDNTETGHASLGNYYNWTAAIASNDSSNYTSDVAINSVCPKGWRLPNAAFAEGGYEFSKLLYAYGVTNDDDNSSGYAPGGFDKLIETPLYFKLSGSVVSGSMSNGLTVGNYWSATPANDRAYYLNFNNNSITPATYSSPIYQDGRRAGFSVRCLAR